MENNIKLVNSVEDLKGLKHNEPIQYKCKLCGKKVIRKYRSNLLSLIKRLLCKTCATIETNKELYGVENAAQSKEIKSKIEATNLRKYGVKSTLSSPVIQEKIKQKIFEKYGADQIFKSKKFREKIEHINLDKYGVKTTLLVPEVQEKIKETNLALYGVDNIIKSPVFREKAKQTKKRLYGDENYNNREKVRQTNLRKYGTDSHLKSKEIRNKLKHIFMDKYGVDHPWKSPEIREKIRLTVNKKYGVDNMFKHPNFIKYIQGNRCRRYLYDGEKFDSSWELALWIYAKDHGEPIERVEDPLEYTIDGKTHYYFPDFKYKGQLVEIKGEQFINNEGIMINVFDHSQDDLFATKQQCAIDHGVRFMFKEDIRFATEYVRHKFNKDWYWYRQFDIVKRVKPVEPFKLSQSTTLAYIPSVPTSTIHNVSSNASPIPQFPPVPLFPQSPIQCMVYPYQLPFYYIPLPMMFNPFMVNTFTSNGIEYIEPDDEGVSPFDCLD